MPFLWQGVNQLAEEGLGDNQSTGLIYLSSKQ
jgi:hypothetical protein